MGNAQGGTLLGTKCCLGTGQGGEKGDMPGTSLLRSSEVNFEAQAVGSHTSCLSWRLGPDSAFSIELEQLQSLHEQISTHLTVFAAVLLFDDATSGLIMGNGVEDAGMNAPDSMTRLGQLLCRWALSQSPSIGILVGVDHGVLYSVQGLLSLPNGNENPAYFGPVSAGARHLADTSRQEGMVHISASAKEQLSALRFLPLVLGSQNTFYLDAFTEVIDHAATGTSTARPLLSHMDISHMDLTQVEGRGKRMSFEEFKELLQSHRVDLSKFGKGTAKSLLQFYTAAVREEKCFLQLKDQALHRFVELVRIHLSFRNSEGKIHELKIDTEMTDEGRERERNQLLAMVLRLQDCGNWRAALERCFETKFGISAEAQTSLFHIAKDAYKYEEYSADSETIPGIVSTYKTHIVFVNIKDRTRTELQRIGLPNGKDFTTQDGKTKWTWTPVVNSKEDDLMQLLQKNGIDISEFTWQSFVELYTEVYEESLSTIEVVEDQLVRKVRIVKIWLEANVWNQKHVLVIKTKQQRGRTQNLRKLRTLSMRMRALQNWTEAVSEALFLRLGISHQQQREALHTYLLETREEVESSVSFPGLRTVYDICEVQCEILNPQDQRWQYIGLPAATDFTFSRQEPISNTGEFDTVITRWGWTNHDEIEHSVERKGKKPSPFDRAAAMSADSLYSENTSLKKVVPPSPLPVSGKDELLIMRVMDGKTTDWARARRAAEQIRSANYSTKDFYGDLVAAFPELRLYCVVREQNGDGRVLLPSLSTLTTSASRSGEDEYQRTIGALFCIFWLMRTHLDGKESFCFGLDGDWRPRTKNHFKEQELEAEYKKRKLFYEKTDWAAIEALFVGAGLLNKAGGTHDVDRTLAMLVLMTIHDVMKLDILRPTVGCGEFGGYRNGEPIGDHDLALSYVLDTCPQALPSFAGLSPAMQESIKFTHCKLDYNMGWLVQAEAPPGALFKAFRKVVLAGAASDRKSASDIAFYFVHWFSDLAGAEAFPLQGCEKFVLKFPLHVLSSFIDSFAVVWNLGPKTETEVFEDYLVWRWNNMGNPKLGPTPSGTGAIAKMRLVLMAQGESAEVMRHFGKLKKADYQVMSQELAITGCANQKFKRDSWKETGGPAILIYYAPALLQKAGREDPLGAMMILAEIFRQARSLWPLSTKQEDCDKTVMVRIDVLKELQVSTVMDPRPGIHYVLCRVSTQDAQVKIVTNLDMKEIDQATQRVLHFGNSEAEDQGGCFSPFARHRRSAGRLSRGSRGP